MILISYQDLYVYILHCRWNSTR